MIIYHQTNKEGRAGGQVNLGIGQPGSFTFYSSLALVHEGGGQRSYLQAAIHGVRMVLMSLNGLDIR